MIVENIYNCIFEMKSKISNHSVTKDHQYAELNFPVKQLHAFKFPCKISVGNNGLNAKLRKTLCWKMFHSVKIGQYKFLRNMEYVCALC
jgi:hypothetical protein